MDEVEENKFHIYRIPVPQDFVSIDGDRGITIALAYDPPVRGSRKEYMARTMFFQPLIGVTADQAQLMLAKFDGEKEDEPTVPAEKKLDMEPGQRRVAYSTLQVRRTQWKAGTLLPPMADEIGESSLTVAVFCQKRFTLNPVDINQRYGLVVDFWHRAANARIYQALRNSVRARVRQQIRTPR